MEWITIVEREGHALSAAARHDPQASVPSCPGWDVDQLLLHVSGAHRRAGIVLRERLQEPPSGAQPEPHLGSLDWYEAGLAALLEAMRGIDPATPVWTFDHDRTAASWFRRMAHETTMHRVDAEQATGQVGPIDPAFAVDGIDESLDMVVPRRAKDSTAGGTVHLHATDVEGEWLVRFLDGAAEIERGHAKGDAAVRGTAAELYLWLWGRADGSGLERFGDADLPDRLTALTRI